MHDHFDQYHHYLSGGPYSSGHPFADAVFLFLPFLILGAVLGWLFLRAFAEHVMPAQVPVEERPSAVELLCQRYVRGEINVMKFEEMLDRILGADRRESETLPSLTRTPGSAPWTLPLDIDPEAVADDVYPPVPWTSDVLWA